MSDANYEKVHKAIEAAYEKLREKVPGFMPRDDQVNFSKAVAECLISNVPLAAEAPTGTGKTVGYMVGALVAAAELRAGGRSKAIVVSTFTKALQGQLVDSDLPKLISAGLLTEGSAVLAKGRGNYFCAQIAEELIDQGELPLDTQISEAELEAFIEPRDIQPLLEKFDKRKWDGDFDSYPGALPKPLDRLHVNSDTCYGRKCPRFSQCTYQQNKVAMTSAAVIVANHDMTLLDLHLVANDSPEGVFPTDDYLLVFDEAHQLPEKALRIGSTEVSLAGLRTAIEQVRPFRKTLWACADLAESLEAKNLNSASFEVTDVGTPLAALGNAYQSVKVDPQTNIRRYPKGALPPLMVTMLNNVIVPLKSLMLTLELALNNAQSLAQSDGNTGRKDLGEAVDAGSKVCRELSEAVKGLTAFVDGHNLVKWIVVEEGRVTLNTCPLEGADVLTPILWQSTRARPAMVSATLRDIDGFGRFRAKSGLPKAARTMVMPYTFPYGDSTITVVPMKASPKYQERKAFTEELKVKLPKYLDETEATLLLFPSRAMMLEVAPGLKEEFGDDAVLVQNERPIKQLIAKHIERVDAKRPSILCGLLTMAEGLDLPGDYCRHVGIMTIPFSAPSDPVEQEVQELLGDRYFEQRSLPDAAIRLIQMVGRLIRRETDRGRITFFDKRLNTTAYGRRLLRALPPFRVVEDGAAARR